jgi:hypothetical protein
MRLYFVRGAQKSKPYQFKARSEMNGPGSPNLELILHKKYVFYKDTSLQRRHNCFKKEVL